MIVSRLSLECHRFVRSVSAPNYSAGGEEITPLGQSRDNCTTSERLASVQHVVCYRCPSLLGRPVHCLPPRNWRLRIESSRRR